MLQVGSVRLRALENKDIDNLYLWENDTEIWSVSETYAPFSRAVLEQFIASQQQDIYAARQVRLVVECIDDSRAVGTVDLFDFDPHSRRAAVGIMIYEKSLRGKGYGRQALEAIMMYSRKVLDMHQLYCDVHADNAASIALFEGAGFRRVGVKHSWSLTDAQWKDVIMLQFVF